MGKGKKFLSLFMKSGAPLKTRLLAALSQKEVVSLYEAFVQDLVEKMTRFPCEVKVLCYLGAAPSRPLFPSGKKRFTLLPQQGSELGERMKHYFDWSFSQGAEKSVLIGSDSPTLPTSYLEEAFLLLDRYEVVIGPATDGGYYLIGMTKPHPEIFKNIPWGSDAVLEKTIFQNRHLEGKLALLGSWYDVDTVEDLRLLKQHLQQMRQSEKENLPRKTTRVLSGLEV